MRKTYKLGDRLSLEESKRFSIRRDTITHLWGEGLKNGKYVCAILTGEKRAPLQGEWYLSGAIPTAYKAPLNLTSIYNIMRLVLVEKQTVIVETIVKGETK